MIPQEAKGIWFVTARRHLLQAHGDDVVDMVERALPKEHRDAFARPMASAWYPEAALQTTMAVAREVVCLGDEARMLAMLEGASHVGIHTFWRIALRLTTPAFALRGLPASWRHLRRGPGTLDVEIEGSRGFVRYRRFPYFDDPNYVLLVRGAVGPFIAVATNDPRPRVSIADVSRDTLTAEVDLS